MVLDGWCLVFDMALGNVSPAAGLIKFLSEIDDDILQSAKDAEF